MWLRRILTARRRNAFSTGRPWSPPTRRGRGSPFQMPARLAVGLGPESDRADGSHQRSPRPSSNQELGPPRWLAGRQASLGCNNSKFIRFRPVVKMPENASASLGDRRLAISGPLATNGEKAVEELPQ